ncbi:hypothetical protein RchiOBHm_Chr6g0291091 [Rosa chinensis]|uniref:Uncharacterized protein n=1 Tax=Rosa chinensis TaxID=74649 RepID=A0A2P6PW28_ROSCH|nr:hypothetical protein RchiOBHm_Chr6g0291091 [Rosa chinensis]
MLAPVDLMDLNLSYGIPVLLGVLTFDFVQGSPCASLQVPPLKCPCSS